MAKTWEVAIAAVGSKEMLVQLAIWSVRGVVLAGAAGVALAAMRLRTASQQFLAWTLVLYACLAMPLLGELLPTVGIPLISIPQSRLDARSSEGKRAVRSQAANPGENGARVVTTAPIAEKRQDSSRTANDANETQTYFWTSLPWITLASATYVLGLLIFLVRLAVGVAMGQRLKRRAKRIADPRVVGTVLAESEFVAVPITVGVIRPEILLPSTWREWEATKFDAVLAHESSHVARRDGLTQFAALAYRAFFWFSPLAWWLERHLAELAEQASDEAVLSAGTDRDAYAQTLLSFFEILQAAPGRVWWQGVAMAKAGQAEKRLERILAWRGAVRMNRKTSAMLIYIALGLPVLYLAASARPVHRGQSPLAKFAVAAAPVRPVAAMAPSTPRATVVAPALFVQAQDPQAHDSNAAGSSYSDSNYAAANHAYNAMAHANGSSSYAYGYDDDLRFVIVKGNSDSITMSGSTEDARHVNRLRKRIPGDFIWFQNDEKSYIIRDQATVDRARAFWLPQEELGKKQEALGKKQEALGKQQEALGDKMEQVRVNVPDMSATLDELKAKLKKLGPTATMEQLGDLQSEIGELQSKIGEIQSQAGEQQGKFGEEQGKLGEEQGRLGEQQGELGRQQAELAKKANRQMKELLYQAIQKGLAQPEPESAPSGTL